MTRILVVEDEEDLSDVLAVVLRDEGHEVTTAENGAAALAAARRQPLNLVLMDLMFPEMDAATFVEHYRRLPGCADSPIIAMSASYRSPPTTIETQAFLAKPFDLEELLAAVREFASA